MDQIPDFIICFSLIVTEECSVKKKNYFQTIWTVFTREIIEIEIFFGNILEEEERYSRVGFFVPFFGFGYFEDS